MLGSRATHTSMAAALRGIPLRSPLPAAQGGLRGGAPKGSHHESALYWVDIAACRLHRFYPGHTLGDGWKFGESISAVAECANHPGRPMALRHELAMFDPEPAQPSSHLGDNRRAAKERF